MPDDLKGVFTPTDDFVDLESGCDVSFTEVFAAVDCELLFATNFVVFATDGGLVLATDVGFGFIGIFEEVSGFDVDTFVGHTSLAVELTVVPSPTDLTLMAAAFFTTEPDTLVLEIGFGPTLTLAALVGLFAEDSTTDFVFNILVESAALLTEAVTLEEPDVKDFTVVFVDDEGVTDNFEMGFSGVFDFMMGTFSEVVLIATADFLMIAGFDVLDTSTGLTTGFATAVVASFEFPDNFNERGDFLTAAILKNETKNKKIRHDKIF